MTRYSIAICNLNMAETIEESLRSILDQVDSATYEVVVVDGGSDDGSLAILHRLADEYGNLRVVELERNPDRHLGEDRNISFAETEGEFILESLDVDDHYYDEVISNFVEIFTQLDRQIEGEFMLHGHGINVAHRSLLVDEYNYPNIPRCEDRHLWRWLFARDQIIWLEHDEIGNGSLGYDRGPVASIRNDIEEKACDFQMGIRFWSCIWWALTPGHRHVLERDRSPIATFVKRLYDIATYPIAYLKALGREKYEVPPEFRERGAVELAVEEHAVTLSELEDRYDVEIDRSRLTKAGRRYFCDRN